MVLRLPACARFKLPRRWSSMAQAAWTQKGMGGDRFERKRSEFRDTIGEGRRHPPQAGRYHLYVALACPWAHRTLLARTLLGLEGAVSVDVVSWRMQDDGSWVFEPELPGAGADSVGGARSLQAVYHAADPDFGGIGTVPVLWDKEAATIVNNESREILRMFDTVLAPALDAEGAVQTLLPEGLQGEVDEMIDANYEPVNNGVYKCGFARSQEAYDEGAGPLWDRLDGLEGHLEGRDWLCGSGRGTLSEADVCLWPTLMRFDPVYHTHFRCNRNLIREMPNLWAFTKRLWNVPGVRSTWDGKHAIRHYYWSHQRLNPHRIVPAVRDPAWWLDR